MIDDDLEQEIELARYQYCFLGSYSVFIGWTRYQRWLRWMQRPIPKVRTAVSLPAMTLKELLEPNEELEQIPCLERQVLYMAAWEDIRKVAQRFGVSYGQIQASVRRSRDTLSRPD